MGLVLTLLRSRKFWVSLVGLGAVAWVASGGGEVPEEKLVEAIVTIVGVFVGSTAIEDAASKLHS